MDNRNLKNVDEHFKFGENWKQYAEKVTDTHIDFAIRGLESLLSDDDLKNKTFLDIGSGSGIHSLAAITKGASEVLSVDIDIDSVNTTKNLIKAAFPNSNSKVECLSVFDLDSHKFGTFDNVYSWGVLHHTGAMMEAIDKAASMVNPGGNLILALYSKTLLCGLWKVEKRIYTHGKEWTKKLLRSGFIGLIKLSFLIRLKSFNKFKKDYYTVRGMDFYNDLYDWLGGYPYESLKLEDLNAHLHKKGFRVKKAIP
jgi:predicted RNA methylase